MNTAVSGNPFSLPLGSLPHGGSTSPSARTRGADFADADPAARLEAQYARRIVARLDQSSAEVPHDLSERLRFARELALQKARLARVAEAAATASPPADWSARAAAPGVARGKPAGKRWWLRLAAVVPLLTLVGGLVLIQRVHATAQIKAAADIDSALLTDDLPPAAYADPAFVEYLKAPRD